MAFKEKIASMNLANPMRPKTLFIKPTKSKRLNFCILISFSFLWTSDHKALC